MVEPASPKRRLVFSAGGGGCVASAFRLSGFGDPRPDVGCDGPWVGVTDYATEAGRITPA